MKKNNPPPDINIHHAASVFGEIMRGWWYLEEGVRLISLPHFIWLLISINPERLKRIAEPNEAFIEAHLKSSPRQKFTTLKSWHVENQP